MLSRPTPFGRRLQRLRSSVLAAALIAVAACQGDGPTTNGPDASEYVLEIVWVGTAPTGQALAAFDSAVTIIRQTIIGALPSVTVPTDFTSVNQCVNGLTGFPDAPAGPLPGLVIYVRLEAMDGPGGMLGSAGPCLVRSETQRYLPALGVIRLDEGDIPGLIENGRLFDVVLHEMLHVVGFGTIWEHLDLLFSTIAPTDLRFLGPRARTACADTHNGGTACAKTVPVHSADGEGSRGSHWRESFFTVELMTPFLSAGESPLSRMTIQSLADLGYTVSNVPAQPYVVTGSLLRAEGGAVSASPQQMPVPMRPKFTLDKSGELVPFRSPR